MVVISENPVDNAIIGLIAIFFLVFVAEKVINKSIRLSKKLGISQIFIGLTIIAVGTSLPEITTSVVGSLDILRGNINPLVASGTIMGTSIGSSIAQQSLILGIVGLLAIIHSKAIYVRRSFLKQDGILMIAAAVLLLLFAFDGKISRIEGIILFFGYTLYLWFLWIKEDERMHNHHKKAHLDVKDKRHIFFDLSYISIGILIVIFSAEYILRIAEFFVNRYGVGSSLIGVMAIGVAAALPELTTSITAMFKGASSISIGILIGSNITNPLMMLGLGAMISGYTVSNDIIWFDIPYWFAVSLLALFFFWKDRKFKRMHAVTLMLSYVAYVAIRIYYFR